MRTRAATPSASAPRVGASRRRSGSRRTRSRSSARPGSCTTSGRSACPKRCCASAASSMTRSGRSCESTRSPARRSSRRSSSSPPALSRSVTTTSASTAAAIPTGSRAKPSRSAHASSRSPTCTMRSRRIGRIAPRCLATRRSSTWRGRRAGRSTAASWRSLSSWRERARRRIRMWTLDQPWRPRGPGAGAGAPRGRRARRLPRRPLARVRLAHARCAPPAWPGRGPCRPGLRRWGERARRGVLLPRRSVQPRPAPLVLRHGGGPRDGSVRGALSRRSASAEEHRVGRRRGVLPRAAGRRELLALLVVGKPRSRRRRRVPLLRGVPAARDRRVRRGLGAVAALTLALVTALIAQGGGDPASALRHVYLIPVAALALAFGRLGGTLGAGATLVLYASVVLPALERSGLTPETMEGLVTFALVGGVGALGGTLTTRARRQRARYETILTVQRALADVTPLEAALRSVRAVLLDRLRAADVGLVVRDAAREVVVGAERVVAGSVAARVLAGGPSVFVPDTGSGRRPRRVLAV